MNPDLVIRPDGFFRFLAQRPVAAERSGRTHRLLMGRPPGGFGGTPGITRRSAEAGLGKGSTDMVREGPAEPPRPHEQQPYPAEKARGGEIILDTPAKRWVFFSGLAGAVILVLVVGFVSFVH
jgi:hypothetical protein